MLFDLNGFEGYNDSYGHFRRRKPGPLDPDA